MKHRSRVLVGGCNGGALGSSKHVTCTCICAACIRAAPQHICFDEDVFFNETRKDLSCFPNHIFLSKHFKALHVLCGALIMTWLVNLCTSVVHLPKPKTFF